MRNKLFVGILAFLIYLFQCGFSFVCAGDSRPLIVTTEKPSLSLFASSKPKSVGSVVPNVSKLIPAAPDFKNVKSYILMDANSGDIIAEKNAHKKMPPASLTKTMTLYLVANALNDKQISLEDKVSISEKAWKTGGSRMFVKVGTNVLVKDLVRGIAVASGNDATVAMAEYLGGSEPVFVELMNQTAKSLNLDNTKYADSSGLTSENNYSTAFDLAKLTKSWIKRFPKYYLWFKEKWITYNNIKQPNRNRLLWRDDSVDGVKTGRTDDAGYCLIASANRNGMRLISVIMGAKNDAMRTKASLSLLNYGFRFFETRKLFAANNAITTPKVYLGKKNSVSLSLQDDLYLTLPIGQYKKVKANAVVNGRLKAPVTKGKVYGKLDILLGNKVITSRPLVALEENPQGNFFSRIFDYILMLFKK